MKKQRPTNYLKFGILFFGIFLLLFNCQKDDDLQNIDSSLINGKSYTVNKISLEELLQDSQLQKPLEKLSKTFDVYKKKQRTFTTGKITSTDSTITLLTNNIVVVSTDSITTYSFLLEIPTDTNSDFENFVLEFKQNEYNYYLLKYQKNESEEEFPYITTIQSVEDSIFEISNFNDYTGKMQSIYSNGCTFLFEETGCTCNGSSSWVLVDIWCGSGGGSGTGGSSNGGNGGLGSGGSGGSGGGGTSNENQENYDPNETGNPHTPTPEIEPGPIGVNPPEEEDDCENLKKLIQEDTNNDNSVPDIKPILENLKSTLSQLGENGAQFKKYSGTYSNIDLLATTGNSIPIYTGGDNYGAAHTHPNSTFPMFSWSDLYTLFKLHQYAAVDVKENVTFILIAYPTLASAQPNIYSITVNDFILFRNKINANLNAIVDIDESLTLASPTQDRIDALNNKLGEAYRKDNNFEKVFLEQFGDHNISLYKANEEITDWSKLDLNESLGTVFETPCN